jgi:four helix bundle protein
MDAANANNPGTEAKMFSHEKLRVYDKALTSVSSLAQLSALWDKRHAVVDHLQRAAESIVVNIAEGARLRSLGSKQRMLDYALGSAMECAACLDIAVLKQFLSMDHAFSEKHQLCEVVKMLVGLRKSWEFSGLGEEPPDYRAQEDLGPQGPLFAHERLDVYRMGLDFIGWFNGLPAGAELSNRLFRQVDKAGTSMVLNLAESNGRYPQQDRRSFLEIAEASTVKAAAYLDLCQRKEGLDRSQRDSGVQLLGRVASMLRGLSTRES